MGDRKSVHSGATATHDRNYIRVVYDAELKDLPICLSLFILICGCAVFDKKRSYLKLRENSVESNISFAPCCGFCSGPDWTNVDHFDRSPYSEECHWIYPWICCFSCEKPKFEVVDNAYMCKFSFLIFKYILYYLSHYCTYLTGCCLKCDPCCCGKSLVLMPFEKFPPPCCCCLNRTNLCDNCFNCCGPVVGNPKIFTYFILQPADPFDFASVAQSLMSNYSPATSAGLNNPNPIVVQATPVNMGDPKVN